jgi:hypothetical protein
MSFTETVDGAPSDTPAAAAGRGLSARALLFFAAAVFLACLAPAVVNGYPVVFPDSEGYILAASTFRPLFIRAFGYSAFIGVTGGLLSLWLTVAAQAVLVAWLVTRMVALESPRWPEAWRMPVALALLAVVLLGHMPWLAAWVQPDLFTGMMLLSLFLLVEHRGNLPRVEQVLLVGVLAGSVTMHLTHPPLLAGVGAFALGALALAWLRRGARSLLLRARRTASLALVAAALGWGALGAANYITYKTFTGSMGGSVFLFARLAADGDVATALRPECEAGKPWVACRFLHRFNLTADEFLWRGWSPLPEMGHGRGFMREAAEINPVLIQRIWPDWLRESGRRALRQLGRFELGDGMDDEGPWALGENLPKHGLSRIVDAASDTRQATDDLRPLMPRPLAETLAITGLAALAGLVAFGLRRHRPDLWWPALLFLAAYAGNAALIALGGEVHGRYGARLVWLAPLLAGLLALRAAAAPAGARRPSLPRAA